MSNQCVDFSKAQIEAVFKAYQDGKQVEFESISPYLADYDTQTGAIDPACLVQADVVGIAIAKVLRNFFPKARMIVLYDDYNVDTTPSPAHLPASSMCHKIRSIEEKYEGEELLPHSFSEEARKIFVENVRSILFSSGVLHEGEQENKDYLLVSERQKEFDVEALVSLLEVEGRGAGVNYIEREGERIIFVNPRAENPKHQRITLRTSKGRWLCAALDASAYVKHENLFITHLVILPDQYKEQQDKVWEILRVLGIKPTNYHNIYYSLDTSCGDIAEIIAEELSKFNSGISKQTPQLSQQIT